MPESPSPGLPAVCRAIIRVASLLVPRGKRAAWLRKWRNDAGHWWAFLAECGELGGEEYTHLVRHCWTAFVDAFQLRFRSQDLQRFVHGPAFVFAVIGVFIAGIAVASGGFSGLRHVFSPLPYPASDRLVVVSLTEARTGPLNVAARRIRQWMAGAKSISGIAAYHRSWGSRKSLSLLTPGLFTVLGVRPAAGRLFAPGEQDAVMLSYASWRWKYNSDPAIVGHTIDVNGSETPVIGVLPEALPGLPDSEVWIQVRQESVQYWPGRWDTIARLRPGVDPESARRELAVLIDSGAKPIALQLASLSARTSVPVWPYLRMIAFGALVGAFLAIIGRQSPAAGKLGWRRSAKRWGFLLLKSILALAAVVLFSIELMASITNHMPPSEYRQMLIGLWSVWGLLLACALAVRWSVVDQRRRCPVCLHRLSMPARIGSWSSVLEPVSTELLCEWGHGSLSLPETESSASEPDHWTAMDESWRDLFHSK